MRTNKIIGSMSEKNKGHEGVVRRPMLWRSAASSVSLESMKICQKQAKWDQQCEILLFRLVQVPDEACAKTSVRSVPPTVRESGASRSYLLLVFLAYQKLESAYSM